MLRQYLVYIVTIILFIILLRLRNRYHDKEQFTTHTINHNGLERSYSIFVPSGYNSSNPTSLLFNFHGFMGNALDHANYADMRTQAETRNFLLVYPQGGLRDGFTHWNNAMVMEQSKSDVDDFGFIRVLIERLSSQYTIDSRRIYACGYSNGGFFSYALACKTDLFAAIGSISGAMGTDAKIQGTPLHPTGLMIIHGTDDDVVLYDGSEGFESIDSTIEYWINHNMIDDSPVITNDARVEHHDYNGDSTSVELYKVNGGGHVWFNDTFNGIDLTTILVDFLLQHSLE